MADFDAELGNDVVDETDGRAEQAAAGNNVVACLQEGKKRRLNCRHTGRSGYRALCAFQCGNAFFKSGSSRIGCTGIGKAFNFFGKQICRMLRAFPHEAAGQKQRLIVLAIFGLLFAAPDGQRLRMKFFVHLFSNLLCIPMDGTIFFRLFNLLTFCADFYHLSSRRPCFGPSEKTGKPFLLIKAAIVFQPAVSMPA